MATGSSDASRTGGRPSRTRICHAVHVLEAGGIVAYPTEGVYGLGCDPFDNGAVDRLLRLKGRAAGKGLILLAARWDDLLPLIGTLTREQRQRLMAPHRDPLTWLVPAAATVPRWIRGDHPTLAVRVTAHPTAAALCSAWDGPLVSTSANPAGRLPARTPLRVQQYFGGQVDWLLAGPLGAAQGPSEIRDLRTGRIIRPGGPSG